MVQALVMTPKKVLIITYYWPPSGGAGVQRWLKLSSYLAQLGHQVHVIHPDKKYASYMVEDSSLVEEIHKDVHTHPTKSFEPVRLFYTLFGKKNVPTAGFSNSNKKNYLQQLIIFLRTHLFIPDPRKFWKKHALAKAKEVILQHKIDNLITSSPPHSTQLIGVELKKQFNIHWIVDFRDLWTDIYYYERLNHSKLSNYFDRKYEQRVIEQSDRVVTASSVYNPIFSDKSIHVDSSKFTTIPNGYDSKDFNHFTTKKNQFFTITYTGTISEQYNINPFLEALQHFKTKHPTVKFHLQFVGSVFPTLQLEINRRGLSEHVLFSPYVPHKESIKYLEEAAVLLVCGPLNKQGKEGGIPAKVYEYLAARKPILYLGKKDGFVATIIQKTASGSVHDEDVMEIYNSIHKFYENWLSGKNVLDENPTIKNYSRHSQAKVFAELLR